MKFVKFCNSNMLKFVVPGGRAAVQGKRRRRAGVTTRVLCIDIGVHNMGVAELEREGSSPPRFLSGRKIDITDNGGVAERIAISDIRVRWRTGWRT